MFSFLQRDVLQVPRINTKGCPAVRGQQSGFLYRYLGESPGNLLFLFTGSEFNQPEVPSGKTGWWKLLPDTVAFSKME